MTGNVGFIEAAKRANCYFVYRREVIAMGRIYPLSLAVKQWYARFIFEWLGVGNGA